MRRKLSEELRLAIEEEIVVGHFPPGMRLDEAQLSERFGASRTPLREALIQLAAEGLVEMRPRRGAVVAEVTPQRLVELFEVMAELEAMCARLAARRISAAELTRLEAAHVACQELTDGTDLDAYFEANERFHDLIYSASHNEVLAEETRRMHRRLRGYRRLQLRVRDRLTGSLAEHAAVVAAIASGDAEGAARAQRDHLLIQGERFSDLLASMAVARAA